MICECECGGCDAAATYRWTMENGTILNLCSVCSGGSLFLDLLEEIGATVDSLPTKIESIRE